MLHGMTGEDDAVAAVRVKAAQQDDEGCAGADDQRIGEDTEALQQPLIDRMGNGGCGSSIGRTSLTRFVREEAALHALHHGDAHSSACRLLPSESTSHDEAQHGGNLRHVHDKNVERQQNVAESHEGNNHRTEAGNAMDAAEDDGKRQQSQTAGHRSHGDVEGICDGIAKRVALHNLVGKAEAVDDEAGKQHAHPRTLQAELHVVGRSAVETLLAASLEELCQRGFHEGCAGSQQSHHPHPEHGSRTAHEDGTCHTCQVACAHSRREADGKGLEGSNLPSANALNRFVA